MTDNGSAYRQPSLQEPAAARPQAHPHRPYTPRTNGKAERFIQTGLREWAYGTVYNHSKDRAAMLDRWIHHYNWHRPHQGIRGSCAY